MRLSRREFLGTGTGLVGILVEMPKIANSEEEIYGFKEFKEYITNNYNNINPDSKGNRENLRLSWSDWEGKNLSINVEKYKGVFILSLHNSFRSNLADMYYNDRKDFEHYEDVGIKGNILGRSDGIAENHYPKLFQHRIGYSCIINNNITGAVSYDFIEETSVKKKMLKKANLQYRKLLQIAINKLKDEGKLEI